MVLLICFTFSLAGFTDLPASEKGDCRRQNSRLPYNRLAHKKWQRMRCLCTSSKVERMSFAY